MISIMKMQVLVQLSKSSISIANEIDKQNRLFPNDLLLSSIKK